MFRVGVKRSAWIAVKWPGLTPDGATVENEVELQVDLVERSTLQAQMIAEGMGADALQFAKKITLDWRGVGDPDGARLAFTPENFDQLLEVPGFAIAFGNRYVQAWNGQSGMREKNSEPSPADGPAVGAAAAASPAS